MNLVHKIESWGDTHHPKFLDIIRVALGIFLFMKGLAFMDNTAYLIGLIEQQNLVDFSSNALAGLVYFVTFAHLVGGAMIMLGILTRLSCLIQLPIVLGAVFLTNIFTYSINAQAGLSIAALCLLLVFTVLGSGPWSLDNYLDPNAVADQPDK